MADSDTSSQYADSEASTPRVGIYYSSEEEGEIEHVSKKPRFAPKYSMRDYELVKQQFELTHFKCGHSFYSLNSDGKWVMYNQPSFRTKEEDIQYDEEVYSKKTKANKTEVKCFINTWFKDDRKRQYDKVQCLPPPLQAGEGVFNLWNGFPVEKYPPTTAEEQVKYSGALQTVLDHYYAVAGGNDTNFVYLLNWNGSIIQFPGKKTKTMPIIKSVEKGTGKGTYKDINVAIIGQDYCYHTSNPSKQLFGQFNSGIKDKLFITFDEANQSSLASIMEDLKSMITEPTQNTNTKYGAMEEGSPSFINVCLLTNRDISWEHNCRRPVYFDMVDTFMGNKQHFDTIYESLKDKRFIRILYEYFMARDLSQFDAERDRPITELQKSMEQRSSPIEIQFLIFFGFHDERWFVDVNGNEKEKLILPAKDLHQKYMHFIEHHKDYKPMNAVQFGHKMKDKIREGMKGVESIQTRKGVVYTFTIKEFKRWLIKCNYYKDEKNVVEVVEGVCNTIGFFFDSDRN